ncbi:MAG: hypothetical protein ACR2RL_23435 [Gammaproteobacteria bacterium]
MSEPVTVESMDGTKKNSPIAKPVEDQSTVLMSAASGKCFWNDREFVDGDRVLCNGTEYECSLGHWAETD